MKDNILENVLSIWLSVCVTKENGWKAQIGKVGRQGSRCSQCLKTCWLTKLCRLVSWSFQLNKKRLNELCINIMDFWRKDIRSTPFSFFFCLSIFSTMLLYLPLSSSSVCLSFAFIFFCRSVCPCISIYLFLLLLWVCLPLSLISFCRSTVLSVSIYLSNSFFISLSVCLSPSI